MSSIPVVPIKNTGTPVIPAQCEELYWLVQVESLSDVLNPNKDHAYILPDDTVWVLSYDENHFVQLSGTGEEGLEILMRVSDGYIQWKHVKDIEWNNLISIDEITAEQGVLIEQLETWREDAEPKIDSCYYSVDGDVGGGKLWEFFTEDGAAPPGFTNIIMSSGASVSTIRLFARFERQGRNINVHIRGNLPGAGEFISDPTNTTRSFAWSAQLDPAWHPKYDDGGISESFNINCYGAGGDIGHITFRYMININISSNSAGYQLLVTVTPDNVGSLVQNDLFLPNTQYYDGCTLTYIGKYDDDGNTWNTENVIEPVAT